MKIRNIIFDFDGVIIDSLEIKTEGFRKIFQSFDKDIVEKLIAYHNYNGGLSRFVKIKYFYNKLLQKDISELEISSYANKYSEIMREKLSSKEIIIKETLTFIQSNYNNFNLHIASGSEEKELRLLNKEYGLDRYFISIYGSPTSKIDNVKKIIKENNYKKSETILIGDSINDYEASKSNEIRFFGYNNLDLKDRSDFYIDSFSSLILE